MYAKRARGRVIAGYAFAVAAVALAFTFRKLLEPVTGTGAPFVLFFGAVLISSLFAGYRAGILAALLSAPIAAREFVVRAGYAPSEAVVQAGLFLLDCAILVYLSARGTRARRAAESAEARLRLADEAAAIGCWESNVATGSLRWSPDLAFPGGGPDSLDRLLRLVHPDDRATFESELARSLDPTGDGTFRTEVRLVSSDGSVRWFSWVGRARPAQALGDPAQQIGTAIDVTERREREEALARASAEVARSAARLRDLIELAPDAFFLADLDGRYTEVNQAACRLLGYERDELVGKTIFDLLPAEDVSRLVAEKQTLLVPGRTITSEWSLRRKDGTLVPVEVSSNIVSGGRWQAFVRDIGERKRIADELRESEERFRLTLDEAPIGMGLVALDGRLVRVNRALCEIVGYAREELERLTFHDITHPEDLALDVDLSLRLARGELPRYQLEKRYIRKDGTVVTVMLSVSLMRSSRGTPLYYIGQVEDITERKRAERALQTSEREFRSLAESMPQIVWATDTAGLNIYFNQQWVDYTGLTLAESYGEGWITPFHPEDRDRAWDAWSRATRYRDSYSLECRLRRADGVYRWWLIRGAPLLGEHGEIVKWFGTCTDIEHIKIAEQKLRESEARQQFLAEAGVALAASLDYVQTLRAVADMIVRDLADWCIVKVVDQSGEITRVAVAAADPARAQLCEALQRTPIDHERPHLLRQVFETKRPLVIEDITAETLASMAQGPEHLEALRTMDPTSMIAVPLLLHGQLLGVLGFLSSGRRRYGPSELRLAEVLAERAAVAIENSRLYHAAVEATQLRDHVLGIVAHDLRNPLGVIAIQVEMLQRSGAEPERRSRKPAETIQRAVARMNRLIEDILDVSRMESGQLAIERARVSAEQIVAEAVEAQQPLAASASVDVRVESEIDGLDVWADRDRILQVFENLIGNALRYTKPGGRITAGAVVHGGEVVFSVTDTGAGIAAEELPHLFDRFWQARKARRAGAGLGLQIVKGIVAAHGGRIWVDSEVGVGTTFRFTIPTAQAAGELPTRAELH